MQDCILFVLNELNDHFMQLVFDGFVVPQVCSSLQEKGKTLGYIWIVIIQNNFHFFSHKIQTYIPKSTHFFSV